MDPVKRVAALLVLILTAAMAAPVTCAGWEGTPDGRRACCKRAHHASCHDQSDADNCCAGHEQGRVATVAPDGPLAHLRAAAILAPAFDAAIVAHPITVACATAIANHVHAPPNLRVVSLRI